MGNGSGLVSVAKLVCKAVVIIITTAIAVVRGNILDKCCLTMPVGCHSTLLQGEAMLYGKKTVNLQLVSLQCKTSEAGEQWGAGIISRQPSQCHAPNMETKHHQAPGPLSVCLQKSLP